MVNLLELLDTRAKELPEFEILHFLDDGENISATLNYRELREKSQKLASFFQASNLAGQRVLICLPQNLSYFIGLYGCLYAGIVGIPAFPPRSNQNLHRLTKIIEDSGATKVLIDRLSSEYVKKKIGGFEATEYIIFEDALDNRFKYQPIFPEYSDIAYLQYTSGSTGTPKGTIISHQNVLVNSKVCIETAHHKVRRAVSWLPLYHDMGLISWFAYLIIGQTTCYMMSASTFTQSPIKWLKAISRFKGEFTLAPNFAFDLCCNKIKDEELKDLDLSSLYSVVCGSEKVKFSTIANFSRKFGLAGFNRDAFSPSYGLAEATLIVSVNRPRQGIKLATRNKDTFDPIPWDISITGKIKSQDIIISLGDPVQGAELEIVSEQGQKTKDKEVGEIYVYFPGSISSGYWGNDVLTEQTFHNKIEGEKDKMYLRTGDLGFRIKDSVFYVGRKKEIIVIRGRKFYPEDIEQSLQIKCPEIEENSIAAVSIDYQGNEELAIIAEIKRHYAREKSFDDLINIIRQEIALEFEIQPKAVIIIPPYSMNKTSSGKIQRSRLKELFLSDQLETVQIWKSENLKMTDSIGFSEENIDRNFFEQWLCDKIGEYAEFPAGEIDTTLPLKNYPIDSISAVSISQDINKLFKIKTRPDVFWVFDSIDELVDYLYTSYLNKED